MFSAAPTVRGEGELAFLSSSTDLGIVCWKTLGDSRTDDTAVVVAVTSGGPATCKGIMVISFKVQQPATKPRGRDTR